VKIVLAVRYFRAVGGMEKFTLNLARFLVERGHVVRGIAFEGDPLPGMEMRRLPRPRGMWRPMRDWLTGRHLAAAVARETDAEVIYGEQKMWGCDVLRPAGGVEDDYWRAHIRYRNPACRGLTALRHLSLKHALDIDAERRGMRDPRLRRVIVNSDMIRRQLLAKYPDLAGRVVVIHEGIERPAEGRVGARAELLSRWGLNPAAPTALFLGHDFRRKGLRGDPGDRGGASASAGVSLAIAGGGSGSTGALPGAGAPAGAGFGRGICGVGLSAGRLFRDGGGAPVSHLV